MLAFQRVKELCRANKFWSADARWRVYKVESEQSNALCFCSREKFHPEGSKRGEKLLRNRTGGFLL